MNPTWPRDKMFSIGVLASGEGQWEHRKKHPSRKDTLINNEQIKWLKA